MSYDLGIYFPFPTFPVREWHDLLANFESPSCRVEFEEPQAEYAESGAKLCYLTADDSLVTAAVSWRIGPNPPSRCMPPGTHWYASISTGMGRSARASWIQFAIPYHALVLLPGTSVHDCQHHVGRILEESTWHDPDGWLSYASRRLRPGDELDLFGADGLPRF